MVKLELMESRAYRRFFAGAFTKERALDKYEKSRVLHDSGPKVKRRKGAQDYLKLRKCYWTPLTRVFLGPIFKGPES